MRALLASSLVGIMCGVLGCFIVLRNMALIGDALAHAILPGVLIAFMIVGYSALGFFAGAVFFGLLAAFFCRGLPLPGLPLTMPLPSGPWHSRHCRS